MNNHTRVLVNTLAQYFRTGVNVILALYATRLVLEALGSNQYGIYTLVGGIVSMLSFFTNALTQTTQRYLSYNSTSGNIPVLKSYFLNSLLIHLLLGCLLAVVLCLLAPFLFSGFLNIEPAYLGQARIVFWGIVGMLFISMMTSPYRAVLISHENIVYLSFVDIIDGVLKLVIALVLFHIAEDRLIWYVVLLFGISLFNLFSISIFSVVRYRESRITRLKGISSKKIKELTSFAGWTLYGMLCLFGRIQGLAIVLNKFFSTVVNAGYGIALQVNSAIGSVSGALQTAIAPQLIKAEGENNHEQMIKISEMCCKISFILISIIGIPLIFNIDLILKVWLDEVPSYAGFLCIILIVSNIIDQLTVGFNSSLNAVGKIKYNHLIVNSLKLLTVVLVAILLFFKVEIYWAMPTYILIEVIGSILRVRICAKYTHLSIKGYCVNVLMKMLVPTAILVFGYYVLKGFEQTLVGFLICLVVMTIIYVGLIYMLGLTQQEKMMLGKLIHRNRIDN